MKEDLRKIIEQFVDFLLPLLTPYEAGLYIFFLRNSYIKSGTREIRIGKRTIADNPGASRGEKTNYDHITKLISGLKEKSCIKKLAILPARELFTPFFCRKKYHQ